MLLKQRRMRLIVANVNCCVLMKMIPLNFAVLHANNIMQSGVQTKLSAGSIYIQLKEKTITEHDLTLCRVWLSDILVSLPNLHNC